MKRDNYEDVVRVAPRRLPRGARLRVRVHKDVQPSAPRLSIVLLDWSCRERFHALDWLARQSIPRDQYELIWIELHERVAKPALARADLVLTLGQRGRYHKHVGYNEGLLRARGEIVTICDSDAVFPPGFVASILESFAAGGGSPSPASLVLMHHEWRSHQEYPDTLADTAELADPRWEWQELVPNAGACMSVRREDALRFGGFDEHPSYRGYLCGPYELGWRLVSAGIPQIWHDPRVALWHFAHPDPVNVNGLGFSLRRARETRYPHVDLHALRAVEALAAARLLPLRESPRIWERRVCGRAIGSALESRYARLVGPSGFSALRVARMRAGLGLSQLGAAIAALAHQTASAVLHPWDGAPPGTSLRLLWNRLLSALAGLPAPQLRLERTPAQDVFFFDGRFHRVPRPLGPVNLRSLAERSQLGIESDLTLRRARRDRAQSDGTAAPPRSA